ncbi:glucokinase [Anabaena sp. FACHB-1237]|uniref:glucokinase n=1 Tax=Anabaena sp. FACHB-1237 TaxID=2692769 RepID=UPI001681B931|nr:glucokinase [Anabaena sp. FACHB-1237]MBD2137699.1 glucokinase [Anabaena sp. FACHB-1237]
MTLLLAGDIGGTKTILRLVESENSLLLKTLYEESFKSADFPDLVPMVTRFLDNTNSTTPEKACFAIAGPVVENTAKLTNLSWYLDIARLTKELGILSMCLINDFAAVGYGIFGLTKQDLLTLQVGTIKSEAPMAVIGAGTGLGQGFLIKQGYQYQVFPSEGGHTDFAPRNELEFQLLQYLITKHQVERVSVERVVSGLGIVSIYQFLRDRNIETETPEIGEAVRKWEQGEADKNIDIGAIIGNAALNKSDKLSVQTMELFVSAYGAEAGNLALKLLPYGGLYIAGGIAPKILPLIQNGSFLTSFTQKGRMSSLLAEIPVHIILNEQVGLIGAALCADRL